MQGGRNGPRSFQNSGRPGYGAASGQDQHSCRDQRMTNVSRRDSLWPGPRASYEPALSVTRWLGSAPDRPSGMMTLFVRPAERLCVPVHGARPEPFGGFDEHAELAERDGDVVVVMFENRSFDVLLGRLYEPDEVVSFEGVIGKDLSNPIRAAPPEPSVAWRYGPSIANRRTLMRCSRLPGCSITACSCCVVSPARPLPSTRRGPRTLLRGT